MDIVFFHFIHLFKERFVVVKFFFWFKSSCGAPIRGGGRDFMGVRARILGFLGRNHFLFADLDFVV